MQAMVATVFSTLRHLPSPASSLTTHQFSSNVSLADLALDANGKKVDPTGLGVRMMVPNPTSGEVPAAVEASAESASVVEEEKQEVVNEKDEEGETNEDDDDEDNSTSRSSFARNLITDGDIASADGEPKPYGVASIKELLRVLISLLNPHDQQHTDSMRLMALGLLNIAFEVAGTSIGRFPSLRAMVADHLCKHLFQVRPFLSLPQHD
jgi:brefeldin A-resistance guanine nucleotide exchange factor 1